MDRGQSPPERRRSGKSVKPLGGGVEIGHAFFVVDGNDGVADLCQHAAPKTVCLSLLALDGVDFRPDATLDHQCVRLAAPDGAEHVFRFRQSCAKLLVIREDC